MDSFIVFIFKAMENATQAADLFNRYAMEYQEKYMDVSQYHSWVDRFLALLEKDATLLEAGCGPGNLTRYMIEQRPDIKILGTDLAPKMIELAKQNNPTTDFEVRDCRNLKELPEAYDAVVCGFCLPYLSRKEVIELISDISVLLKPEGVFYLSTMETADFRSEYVAPSSGKKKEGLYTCYYDLAFLKDSLEKNSFELVFNESQENPAYKDPDIKDLLILAKKIKS